MVTFSLISTSQSSLLFSLLLKQYADLPINVDPGYKMNNIFNKINGVCFPWPWNNLSYLNVLESTFLRKI